MDDIDLILTMLGEAATTRFTRERDSQSCEKMQKTGKSVVSSGIIFKRRDH